ncbi:MAG: hypothetical protein WKI04_14940 [Ferruginibacter sp.]
MLLKLLPGQTYPFGLLPGDTARLVNDKLDCKPYRNKKRPGSGFAYWYYKDIFELIIYLNNDKQLENFQFRLQNKFSKKSAKLQSDL